MWSNLLIILSCGLSLLILYKSYSNTPQDFRLSALVYFTLIFAHQAMPMLWFVYPQILKDALFTSILSVTLVILLIVIRHLKEELSKFPYYTVFSPLVIIIVYPFLIDTYELIEFVNVIIKLVAIIVLILILLTEKNNFKHYYLSNAGVFSIILGLTIYWFSNNSLVLNYTWPLLLASGMIIITFSFPNLLKVDSKI